MDSEREGVLPQQPSGKRAGQAVLHPQPISMSLSLKIWQDTRVGRRPEPWNPDGSASGTSTTQRKREKVRENTYEGERVSEKVSKIFFYCYFSPEVHLTHQQMLTNGSRHFVGFCQISLLPLVFASANIFHLHFPSSHLNCQIFCCCDFKARPHRI